jgi:murein DD-endopeptidase MepM/ murein hydrolase activator NlpD
VAGLLSLALVPGLVHADDLDDERKQVRQKISQTQQKVSSANSSVRSASSILKESREQLTKAQAHLADVQQQLETAREKEKSAKEKLAKAEKELELAAAAVVKGEQDVAAQEAVIAEAARAAYQQQTDLAGLSFVVGGENTGDLANRIQWNSTIFDTTGAELDRLQTLLLQLEAAKEKKKQAEEKAKADKDEATQLVETTESLEAEASAAAAAVSALVAQNEANEAAAKQELAAYEADLAEFKAEDDRVGKLITARIAAEKLAAARRAAAAQAAAARKSASSSRPSSSSSSSSGSYSSSSYWGMIRPTPGRVTSPFGTRIDPINGSIAFHSGTDFAPGCGTPIRAVRAGTVSYRAYAGTYGNRLVISHGAVKGVYLSSAYNHASRYIVSVGQRVQQGQVVGYVGSTGRSTGCHIHFQIYENGDLANPMRFLP